MTQQNYCIGLGDWSVAGSTAFGQILQTNSVML